MFTDIAKTTFVTQLGSVGGARARKQGRPDEWDAVALTFAEPVAPPRAFRRAPEYPTLGVV
jgi:hypothetical protein